MEFFRQTLVIARKDLRAELRTKEAINASLAFALVILVLFSFAFDPLEEQTTREMSGGLLWIVFAFAGTLVLNRSFARELPNDCLDALIAAPISGAALFLGKALANFVLVLAVELVSLPVFGIFYNVHWTSQFWSLLLVLALGTWGLTVIGTIFSALTVNIRLRELMPPLLVYPMLIPALMSAMQLTMQLMAGKPLGGENEVWLRLLVAFRRDFYSPVSGVAGDGIGRIGAVFMREKLIYGLGAIAAVLLARDLYSIFMQLPDEASQGMIYRIIFFHVPAAITAMLCAGVTCVTSVTYLLTKNLKYDAISVAVTEVGLAFLAANLVTGSIWGRIIWGIWWTWDARLTSALVCWLLYAGYLMLRRAIEEPTARARISAVFNIFAFVDVPIVIFSIKWWRTQHPQPVFWGGGSIDPAMRLTAVLNLVALILLAVVLSLIRLRQEEVQREIDSIRRYAHAV